MVQLSVYLYPFWYIIKNAVCFTITMFVAVFVGITTQYQLYITLSFYLIYSIFIATFKFVANIVYLLRYLSINWKFSKMFLFCIFLATRSQIAIVVFYQFFLYLIYKIFLSVFKLIPPIYYTQYKTKTDFYYSAEILLVCKNHVKNKNDKRRVQKSIKVS